MTKPVTMLLLVAWASATAGGAQTLLRVERDSFDEFFRRETPVSGGVRVGVLAGAPGERIEPGKLTVFLPTSSHDRLCVDIVSRDARYQAHLEYDVFGLEAGTYRLEFPTDRKREIAGYRGRELAVLAQLKTARCRGRLDTIAVASWSGDGPPSGLMVLLNTGGLDTRLSIPTHGGGRRTVECAGVASGESRTAFDTECLIDAPAAAGLADTRILRQRYENRLEPIALPIRLP